jgi:hypothetical protein
MEAPRANFIGIKADALNAPEALIVARLSEWQKTTALAPAGRHRRQYAAGGVIIIAKSSHMALRLLTSWHMPQVARLDC